MKMLIDELYIIIVTYNAKKWINECLKSTEPYKVIVVDNCSDDGTVKYIKKNFSHVIILPQEKNFGFGKANNIGISCALQRKAKFVFLLNQDAYLYKGTLKLLHKTFLNNSKFGVLSPIHLNGKGNKLDKDFSFYTSYQFNKDFISDHVLNKKRQEVYCVPFINAAGWFISTKCLETVGGFDPLFFHYGEDDNYCQRVRYHKFKIGIVSDSYLRHDRDESLDSYNALRDDFTLRLERQWKIYFGNINKDNMGEMQNFIRHKKIMWIKTLIKFHPSSKRYKKEYSLLKKIKPEIEKSRLINIDNGSHYLIKKEYF